MEDADKKKLESELGEKLLGGADGEDANAGGDEAPADPTAKPEDELKKRLKSLFR